MEGIAESGLRKAISLRHAVALYVSSVLGSGVLVLPGLAAQVAGPASLLAWAALSVASYPFAYTFATLSARRPESGGVYAFAKEAFGLRTAGVAGWLFALWYVAGSPAATLVAASYLAYAFPLSRLVVYLVAAAVIVLPWLINLRGIVFSGRVQIGVVVAIVTLLVLAVVFSAGSIRAEAFRPFLPRGLLSVGTAAALIFWSYLGYENVSNVAEEFRDPQRDFQRSVLLSVFLIGFLYCAVALVTVGTGAYVAGGSVAPFAALFARIVGGFGAAGTAVLAVAIIFGTVNAYIAGMSRVVYAVAKDGMFPAALARVNPRSGVPSGALNFLNVLALLALLLLYLFRVELKIALLIPSGAAILVYVIGSAAGVKLLPTRGARRLLPWVSLVISLVVLPFVGLPGLAALIVGAGALVYGGLSGPARAARRSAAGGEGA